MDHKAFLGSLPPETVTSLTRRSNWRGLRHLAVHLALILSVGALILTGVPGWWFLLPIQGILLCFLFTLEHEATHKTPFASERLNEWVGSAVGLLIFLPFQWFRFFHLAHHRHTNIPERDPELEGGGHPQTVPSYLLYLTGGLYWWSAGRTLLKNAFGRTEDAYVPPRAACRIRSESRLLLTIYLIVALSLFWTTAMVWAWWLPLLLGQPFLRLYLLAEHGRCAYVADMFRNTRTTYTNRIVRFLAWNMPYHTEHHVFPSVPFHRLPDLHRLAQAHLRETENGYGAFHRNYAASLHRGQ